MADELADVRARFHNRTGGIFPCNLRRRRLGICGRPWLDFSSGCVSRTWCRTAKYDPKGKYLFLPPGGTAMGPGPRRLTQERFSTRLKLLSGENPGESAQNARSGGCPDDHSLAVGPPLVWPAGWSRRFRSERTASRARQGLSRAGTSKTAAKLEKRGTSPEGWHPGDSEIDFPFFSC